MSTNTDPERPSLVALPPTDAAKQRQSLLLVTVLLAVLVVPTSISGTAVALPSIGIATGGSLASLQWVVNAFNLSFGCFTLAWGAVADIIGRKRAFALGAAIYAAASVVSSATVNILLLDVARGFAGFGAAAIFSCGSAMLSSAFEGTARLRAFALFGTVAGIGVAAGPSLAGVLVDAFSWRAVFVLHAVTLSLSLAGIALLPRKRAPRHGASVDIPGTLLFAITMGLAMVGIVQGPQSGWASPQVLSAFTGALLIGWAFVATERRRPHPMLELSLLRNRQFVGLCLIPVAASFGFVTLLTYFPTYLTVVVGKSPHAAGLIMVLLTIPVLFCPALAGKLAQRGTQPKAILLASLVCLVVGDAGLSLVSSPLSLPLIALPMLLVGAGMGLSAGLVDGQAIAMVSEEKAGMAAGVLNTMRLSSEAIAVALYGSLIASLLHDRMASRAASFAIEGTRLEAIANNVAAGNVQTPAIEIPPHAREAFAKLMVQGYDGAFHQLLWILATVCLLFGLFIVALLYPSRRN